MQIRFLALVAAIAAWTGVAADHDFGIRVGSMRCSGEIVEIGDHSYRLVDVCGDPDFRDVVELRRASVEVRGPDGGPTVELGIGELQVVEEWVYRPGPGRLTRVLTVVGGVLTDIRLAERN